MTDWSTRSSTEELNTSEDDAESDKSQLAHASFSDLREEEESVWICRT